MKDEACPTCHIPNGASLKALRDERDRLISFVTQHRTKRDEFLRWEKDLKEMAGRMEKSEEELRRRMEKLANDETALAELISEARRPEQEFEQLRKENHVLRQQWEALSMEHRKAAEESETSLESLRKKLTTEKNKRKDAAEDAAEARSELRELAASNDKMSHELNSLRARYTLESQLLQSARDEVSSLKWEKKSILAKLSESNKNAASLQELNSKLKAGGQQLAREYVKMKAAYEKATAASDLPFHVADLDLLQALSQEVSEVFLPPSEIVSLGSGPLDEDGFDHYLETLGITPYADGCPWIIVGRDGWSEKELNELIDDENFDEIRVFSQEMFIAGILTTHDPFSLPLEILMKFAEGHPALEYLIEQGFAWPEINFEPIYEDPPTGIIGGVDESPLSLIGYHVGVTRGLSKHARRRILESAFKGEIPYVGDDDYMEEWGRPGHPKRLWRIAHHLKREAEKRKTIPSMHHAVQDWQDDSGWLKEKFYTRRMRFKWPDF